MIKVCTATFIRSILPLAMRFDGRLGRSSNNIAQRDSGDIFNMAAVQFLVKTGNCPKILRRTCFLGSKTPWNARGISQGKVYALKLEHRICKKVGSIAKLLYAIYIAQNKLSLFYKRVVLYLSIISSAYFA